MTLSKITDYLSSIGCTFPEIGLLQPADPFLDTTGEDLRRRIFITQENSGSMLCLRPEFTVPVCLAHIESGKDPTQYAYGGSVFRQRKKEAAEFTQAGFEDLGSTEKPKADVECIKTALSTLDAAGAGEAKLVLGDQSIFVTLLDALEIPAAWRKKLVRSFGDSKLLKLQIATMSESGGSDLGELPETVRIALESGDPDKVVQAVSEQMLADGLPLTGGRTPAAIAGRIMEKAELGATRLCQEKRAALESFLEMEVSLDKAANAIAAFENAHDLKLSGAGDILNALQAGLSAQSLSATYRASFGRRLDYYTGLVFEIYGQDQEKPIVGGGRYDHLMTLLGAATEIPAVGFAVWVDRIGGGK
ncbi:MAG: ATP phosphoribosyltransferase regulatory subunit [Pseudomonadota bacterium]